MVGVQTNIKPDKKYVISIFKVLESDKVMDLHPKMHVYLAGMLERDDDPNHKKRLERYVASTRDELKLKCIKERGNWWPYLLTTLNGEAQTMAIAKMGDLGDNDLEEKIAFPQWCYNEAKELSKITSRKTMMPIFESLSVFLSKYIGILSNVYHKIREPGFVVTDEDCVKFKSYILEKRMYKIIIPKIDHEPQQIEEDFSSSILL
ncbi:hypothetical protein ACFL1H_00875 [Nanoarchaeota archaeon]